MTSDLHISQPGSHWHYLGQVWRLMSWVKRRENSRINVLRRKMLLKLSA